MSDNARQIENAILVTLPPNAILTEAELGHRVEQFRQIFQIDDDARDALLRRLHAKLAIRMDVGVALVEEGHTPWLLARRAQIDPFYWDRYSKYLASLGWPAGVVTTVDKVTDDVLDLCGDPSHERRWQRRGLVVGDVQSGKTSTYTALCCKAADAGYRLIILLTGTLESLRRQTQERLDAGFVGLDSSGFLSEQRQRREVGVGLIDHSRTGVVFTSRIKDFSTAIVNQLNFRLDAFHEPIILVVKKNKKILENLYNWLHDYNAGPDELVGSPLLLIDDEADNASVNTRSGDEDPTAINERIRSLLKLFHRASYVGFTATPFANIFIDPESETEMIGDDLFPRDYIYALEPPTNYIGPATLFGEEPRLAALSTIDDAEPFFPPGHKSSLQVTDLPASLYQAIDDFVMANVVRDLRGEGTTHRSMLVNVSHLTDVQMQVAALIEQHVRQMQGDVRNYSKLPETEALRNPTIGRLRDVWSSRFKDAWSDWHDVQFALKDALLPVSVRAVNQRTGAAALDYAIHRETGLRVIAVGGNSLSRGLTLEGLSTSYFYRNSQMYDTLLQMGRWFGYRDSYEDVCRLWLSGSAQHWYRHITRATLELRSEIWRMQRIGLTPKDFGLKVRAHPDSLIVTARNKMRAARTIERVVSFSHQGLETPRVLTDETSLAANALVVRDFLGAVERGGIKREDSFAGTGNPLWKKVPRHRISDILRRFRSDPRNFAFRGTELADFLDRSDEACLAEWDVVVPFGEGSKFPLLSDLTVRLQKRVVSSGPGQSVLVSGKSARVGSRGIEREGMSPTQVEAAEFAYREANPDKRSVPDWAYRDHRSDPLLLIHCIEAHDEHGARVEPAAECFVALGLSFPRFADSEEEERVLYSINVVEYNRCSKRNWTTTRNWTVSAEAIWRALETDGRPAHRRIDDTHPCDFYLGIDDRGARELVLVATTQPFRSSQRFRAFELVAGIREDGRHVLSTRLKRPELRVFFGHLCEDLIESARGRTPQDVMAFVQERIGRWETLFARDSDGLLEEAALRGLLCELLFLRDCAVPAVGPRPAIHAWRGPLGNDHDFEFGASAVEVKSVTESRIVTISSVEQLDEGPKPLHLSAFQLERSVSDALPAFSAADTVRSLRTALRADPQASSGFEDKLLICGFRDHPTYATRWYTLSGVSHFDVVAGFPVFYEWTYQPEWWPSATRLISDNVACSPESRWTWPHDH